MNVVSAIANLVKERDWYKQQYEEALIVIRQITEGVKVSEPELVHPLDMAELFEDVRTGRKYKQSIMAPRKFKNFK